jgi:hypothetical protein
MSTPEERPNPDEALARAARPEIAAARYMPFVGIIPPRLVPRFLEVLACACSAASCAAWTG